MSYQLLHREGQNNYLVHFSRWTSLDAARRFFESDELVRIRQEAGVQSPEFIYLKEIEAGLLSAVLPSIG